MPDLAPVSALSGFRGQGVPGVVQGAPPKNGGPADPGPALGTEEGDGLSLSPEAQRLVAALKATDARVRAHEAAHLAAAGGLARGGARFSYRQGPDGKSYAVGGEVSLDTGAVSGNPQATLAKARQIQQAALAPSDPSPQDRAVAAAAAAMAAAARAELMNQERPLEARASGPGGGGQTLGLALDLQA